MNSKDHAVAASTSTPGTISATHYTIIGASTCHPSGQRSSRTACVHAPAPGRKNMAYSHRNAVLPSSLAVATIQSSGHRSRERHRRPSTRRLRAGHRRCLRRRPHRPHPRPDSHGRKGPEHPAHHRTGLPQRRGGDFCTIARRLGPPSQGPLRHGRLRSPRHSSWAWESP